MRYDGGVAGRPSRMLLVPAALLVQIAGAICILLGTVTFALTLTSGDKALAPILIGWVVAALSSVICGGLVWRGNVPALVMAAGLDAVFGIVLVLISRRVGGLVKMLGPDDIAAVGWILLGVAILAIAAGILCLVAIPQARRYAEWLAGGDEADPGTASLSLPVALADVLEPAPASTAKGWTPARATTAGGSPQKGMVTLQLQIKQGKRRLYFALCGLAVGIGAGVGVLIVTASDGASPSAATGAHARPADLGTAATAGDVKAGSASAGSASAGSGGAGSARAGSGGGSAGATAGKPEPIETAQDLLVAEHAAIGRGDFAALAALAIPTAFAFGTDADEVADGRAAIEATLRHDLGPAPADGFGVDGKHLELGEWRDHAWIAEELEITGAAPRRYEITQLAAKIEGRWAVVAWHWAVAVGDQAAERHAKDGTLPRLGVVPDRPGATEALDSAARTALGSRTGFAAAYSTRPDAFNFGSAGERLVGGATIKKLFGQLRADIALAGGAIVVGGNAWDKSQKSGAWIAYAAANVDFTPVGHPTQPFRVLAILIQEDDDRWQLVQSHFSLGGPIK